MNIDDNLLAIAMEYSGSRNAAPWFRVALEEFVQKRAELRRAKLKGSIPDFGKVPARRRRPLAE